MLNITRNIVLSILAVIGLLGCRQSMEAKLLGSWDAPAIDASNRISFRSDHTFEGVGDGLAGIVTFKGTWHLDGDQLSITYEGREPVSETIVEITKDELRLKDARGNEAFAWKRVR